MNMGKMKNVAYANSIANITTNVTTKTKVAGHVYVKPPAPVVSHLPMVDPTALPSTTLMRTLYHALSLRRAAGSLVEAQFVAWLCNRLPVTMVDELGNIHVDTRKGPHHRTMFTSHTDTVHYNKTSTQANAIRLDGNMWRADGAALGADDGAGIALMLHMLEHGIPGYYIFFRGEECGGVGSSGLADAMPGAFYGIDRAIAFDRAGYHDVITHQSGGRCCSDAFADALSAQLSTDDMEVCFVPSQDGVFTDTANLMELVAECTNISVGYKNQHGDREEQDVAFLQKLADRLVQVQWDDLPVERDPRVRESRYSNRPMGGMYTAPHDANWMRDAEPMSSTNIANPNAVWYDEDREDREDAGYDEAVLMEAILEALDGDYVELLEHCAEHMYPEDATQARKWLSVRRISDEVLTQWYDALESGETAAVLALDEFVLIAQVN